MTPAPRYRMSILPPCSRGGVVRKHPLAVGASGPQTSSGVALIGSGSLTDPPRAANSASRASISACSVGPGRTVTMPGKLAFGIRTPGTSSETASVALNRHVTRSRSENWSAINPPRAVNPNGPGAMSTNVTASVSPTSAPSMWTGPAKGWTVLPGAAANRGSAVVLAGSRSESTALRT